MDRTDQNNFAQQIENAFTDISESYDLANHVLSLGLDIHWRKVAAKIAARQQPSNILDLCCGTGDFAFSLARQTKAKNITGCDFSPKMIELAKQKQKNFNKNKKFPNTNFQWLIEDCSATTLPPDSFDLITCAFGIRNMANLPKALSEFNRLLKPSGTLCILEFSLPVNPLVRCLYLAYFKCIMPAAGGCISGNYKAYKYLKDSVIAWQKNINLTNSIDQAGFQNISQKKLTLGVATVYLAKKPD